MPVQAKAVVFQGQGTVPTVQSVTVRAPQAGEVLVKMRAAGICHSDLHVLKGEWPTEGKIAMGHEGSGIVEMVGEGVQGMKAGDQVVLSWYAPCSQCGPCKQGKTWLCMGTNAINHVLPDGSTPISDADGGPVKPYLGIATFSDYVVVPEEAVVRIPNEVPAPVAALIGCSIATGIGAVLNTAEVPEDSTAVVVGAGGVGQAIILGLKLAKAEKIIVLDLSEERLEIARQFGATHTISGADETRFEQVKALTGGEGVDYAFDAIGLSVVANSLVEYLKNGGAAVLVGMPDKDSLMQFKAWPFIYSGQRLLGCNYGSSRPKIDFVRIAELYLSGDLDLDQMVGDFITQEEVADAIKDLERSSGKRTILSL